MGKCSQDSCGGPTVGRGLCSAHYQYAKYHGEFASLDPAARPCENCGQLMAGRTSPKAKYCSPECKETAVLRRKRAAALKAAGTRKCLICGTVIPESVTLKAKCCSRECGVAWQNAKRDAAKRAAWAAEGLRCERCGKPIPVPETGKRRTKYCSEQCKYLTLNARWCEKSPHYNRQRTYGITQEQHEVLLASQDGRCAICGSAEWPAPVKGGRPHVDHDHATGAIRGLLCGHCNNGLGNFGDDPPRLRSAADYLERACLVT